MQFSMYYPVGVSDKTETSEFSFSNSFATAQRER